MSLLIRLALIAAAAAVLWAGYLAWRESERDYGRNEIRAEWRASDQLDADVRASDARQQRRFNDLASGKQAAALALISNQLGAAREKIATLSGRVCLDASTVRVLNGIGVPTSEQPGRATASQPAGQTDTAATDQDVGISIAVCRSEYAKVSSQLNQILDIEDRRHPPEGVLTR